jgi:hypothetical protein
VKYTSKAVSVSIIRHKELNPLEIVPSKGLKQVVTFPSLHLVMEKDTDLENCLKKTQENGQCQKYVYCKILP